MHQICSTCLLLLLISKILKGLDYDNTTLVDCLFSRDDFDCSVIRTWGNDKSKAVVESPYRKHGANTFQKMGAEFQSRERNVVRFSAAVSGEERCVTTLKTAE